MASLQKHDKSVSPRDRSTSRVCGSSLDPSLSGEASSVQTSAVQSYVQRLCSELQRQEDGLAVAFIATYRDYCKAGRLLRALVRELHDGHSPIGAIRMLTLWVSAQYESDFAATSPDTRSKRKSRCQRFRSLKGILARVPRRGEKDDMNALKLALLRACRNHARRRPTTPRMPPVSAPIQPQNNNNTRMLMKLDAHLIAKKLRIINRRYLLDVSLPDLVDAYPGSSMARYFDRQIRLTSWCASMVLVQETAEMQSKVATKLLYVAKFSADQGDYFACIGIMMAFELWACNRLRDTWRIHHGARIFAGDMAKLTNATNNYKECRAALANRIQENKLCIPPPGPFSKDIAFVKEGNTAHTLAGHVNETKLRLLATIQTEFHACRRCGADMPMLDESEVNTTQLEDILTRLPSRSTEELDAISERFKPRPSSKGTDEDSSSAQPWNQSASTTSEGEDPATSNSSENYIDVERPLSARDATK